jgi:hypothetical protein
MYDADLTAAEIPFGNAARGMFTRLGSPGGATNTPRVPDPPFVLGLPPQEHNAV